MDGDRLCVVFEELAKEDIQRIVQQHDVEMIDPLDANPIEEKADDTGSKTMGLIETLSTDEKPCSAKDKAFKSLSEELAGNKVSGEVRKLAATTLNEYLGIRFTGVDSDAYTAKLSDEQCLRFIDTFGLAMPKRAREGSDLRFKVASTIRRCQKIAQM